MSVDLNVSSIEELRERVARLEGGPALSAAVPTHPRLSPLLQLRAGGVYGASSMSTAMLLMAGPSAEGGWTAAVGLPQFGCEAAPAAGVELTRTVLVPDPGEHWLEVVTVLASAVQLIVFSPRGRTTDREAAIVRAKLRQHGGVLVALGEAWPRLDAQITERNVEWLGLGSGHGHLQQRLAELEVRGRAVTGRRRAG